MRRKELYGTIVLIAVAFLIAAWVAFLWTMATGLTLATRSSRGRVATESDLQRVRAIAVLTTLIAGPAAALAEMKRRRS